MKEYFIIWNEISCGGDSDITVYLFNENEYRYLLLLLKRHSNNQLSQDEEHYLFKMIKKHLYNSKTLNKSVEVVIIKANYEYYDEDSVNYEVNGREIEEVNI